MLHIQVNTTLFVLEYPTQNVKMVSHWKPERMKWWMYFKTNKSQWPYYRKKTQTSRLTGTEGRGQ